MSVLVRYGTVQVYFLISQINLSNKSSFFFDCLPSYDNGYLDVGNGHSIYFEQYGNPKGIPILFLHGGPGAGFSKSHKSFLWAFLMNQ